MQRSRGRFVSHFFARTRSVRTAMFTAGTAAALGLSALASPASAAALAVPRASVPLPNIVDATGYTSQDSCNPTEKPGVASFRHLMWITYYTGRNGGIVRSCSIGGTSEHKEGRAFDWMLSVNNAKERAVANQVTSWLTANGGENARRLGVMYIIWNQHIWGAYNANLGWRSYRGASEHTDHIHFSFTWAGAMKRTSWWTGRASEYDYGPCRPSSGALAPAYSTPRYTPCPISNSDAVSRSYVRVAPTPAPTPTAAPAPASTRTVLNLSKYYFNSYLTVGAQGQAVKDLQYAFALPDYAVDGVFGPVTRQAVMVFQRRTGLPVTGTVYPTTWWIADMAQPGRDRPTYQLGSRSNLVKAMQMKLGISPADGIFGSGTEAAIKRFQQAHGLAADGIVGPATWAAIGRL